MRQKVKEDFEFINETIENEKKCQNSGKEYAEQEYVFPRIDNFEAKQEIVAIAGRYLENDKFHSQKKTNLLLQVLLDIEIYPLKRELISKANAPGGLFTSWYHTIKNACSWPIRFALSLVEIGIFIIQILLVILAFQEPNALTILFALVCGLFLCKKFAKKFFLGKKRENLEAILSVMKIIRDEISCNSYSPERITEKLKKIEEKGGYVYSVVYSLLALR